MVSPRLQRMSESTRTEEEARADRERGSASPFLWVVLNDATCTLVNCACGCENEAECHGTGKAERAE